MITHLFYIQLERALFRVLEEEVVGLGLRAAFLGSLSLGNRTQSPWRRPMFTLKKCLMEGEKEREEKGRRRGKGKGREEEGSR